MSEVFARIFGKSGVFYFINPLEEKLAFVKIVVEF